MKKDLMQFLVILGATVVVIFVLYLTSSNQRQKQQRVERCNHECDSHQVLKCTLIDDDRTIRHGQLIIVCAGPDGGSRHVIVDDVQ